MVRVTVLKDGVPVEGAKVKINFVGRLKGMTPEKPTDAKGQVTFQASPDDGIIYVNDEPLVDGLLEKEEKIEL